MTSHPALQQALVAALASELGAPVAVEGLAPLPGGASRETWRLDLTVLDGPDRGIHRLVARRERGGKIYEEALDVPAEFRVLETVWRAGVPVPRPFRLLTDVLGQPAALVERLDGETIGRRVVKEPALAAARERLPAQLGAALAMLRRLDVMKTGLRALLPVPAPGQTPVQAQLDQFEADLDRIGEPHPALELCLRWLRCHEPPAPDRLVLVHGDFRIGNVVVGPDGLRGLLDWEFAHVGDPMEDLTWGLVRDWRFGVDHVRFGGVGEPEVFFRAYERAGGGAVDRDSVPYWEVLGNVRWAIGTLNQALRFLRGAAPDLELASLGRRCAEMELEALRLIKAAGGRARSGGARARSS